MSNKAIINIKNSLKLLSLEMVNNSGYGDVKKTLSFLPILYDLYSEVLNVNPSVPTWINRDRFIVASSDVAPALYSILHFAGYNISTADLQRYGYADSFTPTNLIKNLSLGIEATYGCSGQSIGNAVGCALCERYLESICKSINPNSKFINYYTYVLCSNKDIEEGTTYEALSFASVQKLKKLIVICNNVSNNKDTLTDLELYFDALDMNVISVKDSSIVNAIKSAKKSKRPSVIIVDSKLDKNDDIDKFKQKSKLSSNPYEYDDNLKQLFEHNLNKRIKKIYDSWQKEYDLALASKKKDYVDIIDMLEQHGDLLEFDVNNYKINDGYDEELIKSNEKVFNFVAPKTKYIIGGTAGCENTLMNNNHSMQMLFDNPTGRNIDFGFRENSMGSILNGIALNNIHAYGVAKLTNADNLKQSIKYSAIMNLPVTYIFTNDGVSIGKDGMIYQAFDAINMLRGIPNLVVLRPADINEILGCWDYVVKNKVPVCIVVGCEKISVLKHTNGNYIKYGAYIVQKEHNKLDGIIVATGTDVTRAINVAKQLYEEKIDIRVVSMPSQELLLQQNQLYIQKLLPKTVPIITLEASSSTGWSKFASSKDNIISIDTYGTCGNVDDVVKYLEFDDNSLYVKVKNIIEKSNIL